MALSSRSTRFWPSNITFPFTISPGASNKFTIAFPIVDFPAPLSPTIPRTSSDQEIVDAVRNVCITLRSGEVLGIVGESGAGKSTIAFPIVDFPAPLSPTIPRTSPDLRVMQTLRTASTIS
jgi:ABC-type microcin C transport system duplicated ATPase subunit YejF